MSTTNHISFEELAGNLTDVFNKVRKEHTSVVVEYATGEKVMIQPLPAPQKRKRRKKAAGMQRAILGFDPNNVSALRLYAALGFQSACYFAVYAKAL